MSVWCNNNLNPAVVSNQLCVFSFPSNITGDICFTIASTEAGWAAIGSSSSMLSSNLYIGWMNADNSTSFSERTASSYAVPSPVSSPDAYPVPLYLPAGSASWSKTQFSFCRPMEVADLSNSVTSSAQFIYAASIKNPKSADQNTLALHQHDMQGAFSADFVSGLTNFCNSCIPTGCPTSCGGNGTLTNVTLSATTTNAYFATQPAFVSFVPASKNHASSVNALGPGCMITLVMGVLAASGMASFAVIGVVI